MKKSELRKIIEEEIKILNETSKTVLYLLNGYFWLSYSPGSGTTLRIRGRGYITDKSSDKNYDDGVSGIVKWSKTEKPIKKTKTQSLYKIPEYEKHVTDATNMDIWGGEVKPNKWYYVVITYGKFNIINIFDNKSEAIAWVKHTV